MWISTVSATFSGFFSAFGFGLGAVLGISAVSATFFCIFFGFWVDFGSCFKSFMDYSSTRVCLLCYQPMAIVHYAMQIEQLSDIKALVMRLKSDPVPVLRRSLGYDYVEKSKIIQGLLQHHSEKQKHLKNYIINEPA